MYASHLRGLGLLLILLLAGCSTGQRPPAEEIPPLPSVETPAVDAPQTLEILYPNPVTFVYNEQPTENGYRSRMEGMEGLASKEMTSQIRQRIDATYDALGEAGVPAYRGIRVFVGEGEEPVSENLYMNESFNHNGLMSLIFNHEMGFEGDRYVSELIAETFDMSSGELLQLVDLFENDLERVLAYFNQRINERLKEDAAYEEKAGDGFYWYGDRLRLAGRFDGIAPDQTFYLGRTGLTLVFDHRTPAFATGYHPDYATGFHPAYLQIPYDEISRELTLIDAFFSPRPSLFSAESPLVPELIVRDSGEMGGAVRSETREGVTLYVEARYPEPLPSPVAQEVEELLELDEALLARLIDRAPSVSGEASYHHYLWMNYWGPFLSLNRNIDLYDGTTWESHALYRIYDEQGERLLIEDLFVDPDLVIRDHLLPALEREMEMARVTEEVTAQDLVHGMSLGLGGSEINVATEAVEVQGGGRTSLRFHVTFQEVGVDQLKFLSQ